LNEDGLEQGGMGLGIGDYDCDGYLDVFKTNFTKTLRRYTTMTARATFRM
jgi:hypothetical protein